MVRFEDIKKAMIAKHGNNIKLKKVSNGIMVNYGGYKNYIYRGSNSQVAKKLGLNLDEINLKKHGVQNLNFYKKIKINIFGKNIEATINNNKILFWYSYRCGYGEPYDLTIYKNTKGYYFNLDRHRIYFDPFQQTAEDA